MIRRNNRKLLQLFLVMVLVLACGSARAASGDVSVTAEQWSRVSSPAEFMAIDGLREIIAELNQQPGSILNIHYQGGENGLLWAQQFRNRLVALGIESSRIQLVQGVPNNNTLVVELQETR